VAIFAVRMDVRFEQRVNIKFCVKLGKTATEALQLLCDATVMKLYLRLKKRLKERRQNIEAIQAAATMELTGLLKEALTSGFQDLQKRWQQCIDCEGNYFKGDTKH
jgi:hypothetical protein